MPELIPVLSKNAIARKVSDLARRITADYQEGPLVLIGVLKGAFIFLADLARKIDLPHIEVDFVQVASYGAESESSGRIAVLKDITVDVQGKDLLIVDDILDTGLTLNYLRNHLLSLNPRSVKICVMVDKHERRAIDLKADYACHATKSGFIVGYGLDHAEGYRHLSGLFILKM